MKSFGKNRFVSVFQGSNGGSWCQKPANLSDKIRLYSVSARRINRRIGLDGSDWNYEAPIFILIIPTGHDADRRYSHVLRNCLFIINKTWGMIRLIMQFIAVLILMLMPYWPINNFGLQDWASLIYHLETVAACTFKCSANSLFVFSFFESRIFVRLYFLIYIVINKLENTQS